jgi:hypothetical protein
METKLTLSLDKDIIEKAKKYAKRKHTSLSTIVENYFYYITSSAKENNKVTDEYSTPITDELSGSLGKIEIDTEKEITKYLMQKYIHE